MKVMPHQVQSINKSRDYTCICKYTQMHMHTSINEINIHLYGGKMQLLK